MSKGSRSSHSATLLEDIVAAAQQAELRLQQLPAEIV